MKTDDSVSCRENTKRENVMDPRRRSEMIREAICWAGRQPTARRDTPAACIANEARILASRARGK
ncbi:MAG: hypothetical protein U1E27_06695 [Kiritimatiellia bacterium]|nr:hypothetical protein [Kiritimatiellia bacterium]